MGRTEEQFDELLEVVANDPKMSKNRGGISDYDRADVHELMEASGALTSYCVYFCCLDRFILVQFFPFRRKSLFRRTTCVVLTWNPTCLRPGQNCPVAPFPRSLGGDELLEVFVKIRLDPSRRPTIGSNVEDRDHSGPHSLVASAFSGVASQV